MRAFGEPWILRTLDIDRLPAWARWPKSMDASMAGGAQTTFIGVVAHREAATPRPAAAISWAIPVDEYFGRRILTEQGGRRLGSGEAEPRPIDERRAACDVVLQTSDGAWTLLQLIAGQRVVMALMSATGPMRRAAALLDLAGAKGRADDMTVVAMRVLAT